jgi:hypothetical protein
MAEPNPPAGGTPAWDAPYPADPYSPAPYPQSDNLPLPAQRSPYIPAPAQSQPIAAMPVEAVIAQIGDIQLTATTVHTPVGSFPLRGSRWHITDHWVAAQRTPTWAVVLAIVGFFCLTIFSLLFLLAKETTYSGIVQVTVTSGPYQYDTRIGVTSQLQVQHAHNMVNYARSLAAV